MGMFQQIRFAARHGKSVLCGRFSSLLTVLSVTAARVLAITGDAAARPLDTILKDGTLKVGVNPNFPPMSAYGMTNQLEGFDVDIGNRIAAALGVKVQFIPTEAAQRVAFLTSGRIDIALGALTRTPDRAKLIDFTVPLHTEAMGVLTTEKVDAASWADLNSEDITLVNMRGNLSVDILKERLPKAKVLLVDGNADTVRALAQGRADALVENIDFFMNFTKFYRNVKWRVLDDPIFVAWCGIGVARDSRSLRDYLNVLLFDMHKSGTVNEIWQKWYGAPMVVPIDPDPFF